METKKIPDSCKFSVLITSNNFTKNSNESSILLSPIAFGIMFFMIEKKS